MERNLYFNAKSNREDSLTVLLTGKAWAVKLLEIRTSIDLKAASCMAMSPCPSATIGITAARYTIGPIEF